MKKKPPDTQKLIQTVCPYEFVSFDIFDTLLIRDVVKPEDVFFLVHSQMREERVDPWFEENDFVKARKEAERRAREKSAFAEVTFEEIYAQLPPAIRQWSSIIMACEIRIEKAVLQANSYMIPVFEYCKKESKKVILISNMYLSEEILREVLSECGILGYDALFVSCDYRATKHTGKLFSIVQEKMDIKSGQWIHLGDALRGDFLIPRRMGINSIHIARDFHFDNNYHSIRKFRNDQTYSTMQRFIENHASRKDDAYCRFGYGCLGPMLHGFCAWLKNQLDNSDVNKLFFLSREGKLLLDAYVMMYPSEKSRCYYLHISRHSISIAMLSQCECLEEMLKCLPLPRVFTLETLLKICGIPEAEMENKVPTHLMSMLLSYDTIFANEEAVSALESCKDSILENAYSQYSFFIQYLNQVGVSGKVAIVDIGWKATMQHLLEKLLHSANMDIAVFGYYIGLQKNNRLNRDAFACAYLHDRMVRYDLENQIAGFCGLLETVMTSMHGSVRAYERSTEGVRATFYPFEYDKENGQTAQAQSIHNIQMGALAFVKSFSEQAWTHQLRIPARVACANLLAFGCNPRRADVQLFDSFAFFNVEMARMTGDFLTSIRNGGINAAYHDFSACGWKIGYLKKHIRLPIPYNRIYGALRATEKKRKSKE